MRIRTHTSYPVFLLIALISLPLAAIAQSVEARLRPSLVVVGQPAWLEIEIIGVSLSNAPALPPIPGARTKYEGFSNRIQNGRRSTLLSYSIIPQNAGALELPAMNIGDDPANAVTTRPLRLDVLPTSALGDPPAPNRQTHAVLLVANQAPWVGQRIPAQMLLLVDPGVQLQNINQPQIPRENIAAERLEDPTRFNFSWGGRNWNAFAFSTWITPLATGRIVLGPAETKLVILVQDQNQSGIFARMRQFELSAKSEALPLDVKPLPPGAPPGFQGVVGSYQMSALLAPPPLAPGDPLSIKLAIRGTGDASQIAAPPALAAAHQADWEVIPGTRQTTADSDTGVVAATDSQVEVGFNLILRPRRAGLVEVPPFELPYFNPATESYHVAATKPIPLAFAPDAAPTPLPVATGVSSPALPGALPAGTTNPASGLIRAHERTAAWQLANTTDPSRQFALHAGGLALCLAVLAMGLWLRYHASPCGLLARWRSKMRANLREVSRLTDPGAQLLAAARWLQDWQASPYARPLTPAESGTVQKLHDALARQRYAPEKSPASFAVNDLATLLTKLNPA